MKLLNCFLASLAVTFFATATFSQGLQSLSTGKAVVYFTRISAYGFSTSFEFFHNDQYIGAFKGKNYMCYECDLGEQLFWASTENKEFLTADLKEGYIRCHCRCDYWCMESSCWT